LRSPVVPIAGVVRHISELKPRTGVAGSVVRFPLSPVILMLKPGRKSKGICPAQLHLKVPEDVRLFIQSYGQESINERVVKALRELSNQRCPSTIPALKSRLKNLTRESRRLQKPLRECNIKLDELIPDETEQQKFWDEINSELEQERKD
jgi:hypothetical protein